MVFKYMLDNWVDILLNQFSKEAFLYDLKSKIIYLRRGIYSGYIYIENYDKWLIEIGYEQILAL